MLAPRMHRALAAAAVVVAAVAAPSGAPPRQLPIDADVSVAPPRRLPTNQSACQADDDSACKCLLACEVFGGNSTVCESAQEKSRVIEQRMLSTPTGQECEEITCVVGCAARLGCLDTNIMNKCAAVKQKRNQAKTGSCPVDCINGSPRAAGSVLAVLLAVGTILLQ